MPLRIKLSFSTVPVQLAHGPEDTIVVTWMSATSNTQEGVKLLTELKEAVEANPELAQYLPDEPTHPFDGLNRPEILREIQIFTYGDNDIGDGSRIRLHLASQDTPFSKATVEALRFNPRPA